MALSEIKDNSSFFRFLCEIEYYNMGGVERLLDERKDDGKDYELDFVLKQETEWELGIIYQAQKSMDYIIEEDN